MSTTTIDVTRRTPRIGILGHFGDRNLGDEAIIEAFSSRLRKEFPGAELLMFSMHPADTANRYRCAAYPIRQEGEWQLGATSAEAFSNSASGPRSDGAISLPKPPARESKLDLVARLVPRGRLRSIAGSAARACLYVVRETGFLRRSFSRVRNLDVLFITGSNQFLDNFGGAWGFPYTLLKWTVLARARGCRVCFVSMGAGPLDGTVSKRMVRWALRLADYVSFRDEGSRSLVERGCGISGPVVPDLAFGVEPGPPLHAPRSVEPASPVRVAINAMPVHDPRFWHAPDPVKYEAYVATMGAFAKRALELGFDVSFFATHFPDANVARDAIEAATRMSGSCGKADLPAIDVPNTVGQVMDVVGSSDIVVATRFHGILLGLVAGKPTIGICYYRKSRELLNEAGQADFAFDIDAVETEPLIEALVRLRSRMSAAATSITEMSERHRRMLEEQFGTLAQLVRDTTA